MLQDNTIQDNLHIALSPQSLIYFIVAKGRESHALEESVVGILVRSLENG